MKTGDAKRRDRERQVEKKDAAEMGEEAYQREVEEGIRMNELYHITCNSNNGLVI